MRGCTSSAARAYTASCSASAQVLPGGGGKLIPGPRWNVLAAVCHLLCRWLPCLLSDLCQTLCCGACAAAAGWVYCTMATMGVDFLEKQKRYKEAVQRLDMLLGEWQGRVGL